MSQSRPWCVPALACVLARAARRYRGCAVTDQDTAGARRFGPVDLDRPVTLQVGSAPGGGERVPWFVRWE